jgi:hypothetical protein
MVSPGARSLSIALLVLTACSGAAATDLFEPGGRDDPSTSKATPPVTQNPVPDPGTPDPPAEVADGGRPDNDPPAPTCTQEAEPNGDLNRATLFTASLCGKLDGNSDVDFGRFVAPLSAKTVAITHEEEGAKVNYRYYLNGQSLPGSDSIPAVPGATYGVQIRLANGSPNDRPNYRLSVTFQ